jgi:Flp pilus assembly protein TadG
MRRLLKRLSRDERGAATIELAGVGVVVAIGLMNAAEIGRYAYQTTEVSSAAQAGAEAALAACDLSHTPALANCPDLSSAVRTAIQSTPLGAAVSLDGAMTEAYYCVDTHGELQKVAASGSKPADCSAVSNPDALPTLYLQVPVQYAFTPLFPGLTLTRTFAATIRRTSWMRMA